MVILFNDWIIAWAVFYQLALSIPPMIPDTSRTPEARRMAQPTARLEGFPARAAAASILAHVVLLAILMNARLPPSAPMPDPRVISMPLIPAPVDPQPPAPVEAAEQRRAEPPSPPAAPSEAPAPTAPDTPPADRRPDDPNTDDEMPVQAGALRATLLEQVRSLPVEAGRDEGDGLPWISSGAPVPGVPGLRGWLSGYAGTVTPGADTWKENDGSSRGRYVLANGTVICTRRRAPTIDELMNPWKSTAVTMGSICGRQRPDAPDFSDPRVQPPPFAVRESPANGG